MENKDQFINRELSWLRFNSRVLAQCSKDLPLLEKLKFIAIYCTNLDEFYMIRIAGLKQLFAAGIVVSGSDEMTPLDQLREIRKSDIVNAIKEIDSKKESTRVIGFGR